MFLVYKWTRKRMPTIGHKREFSLGMRDSSYTYTAVVCKRKLSWAWERVLTAGHVRRCLQLGM